MRKYDVHKYSIGKYHAFSKWESTTCVLSKKYHIFNKWELRCMKEMQK